MLVALLAYLIDRIFGEFPIKHPVVWMGEYIAWFERRFWRDSVFVGALLALSLILIVICLSWLFVCGVGFLPHFAEVAVTAVVSSVLIAANMLYASVKNALTAEDKRAALGMLVSRDTAALDESDIHKALIETYAENLNDAVIAPLFYLSLLGLPGIAAYKAINTLDSMVGYRTDRYEKFGKFSARLDDIAGFIPARITALLIALG
ncbi:MAG TPA: adenosylcobinamide-phosphate synthase CbiB, partial [Campylobacterales bacterium]|nr:adenosylcobinamide-phosphate synthase CbiB [Campylobacterales bacterium]